MRTTISSARRILVWIFVANLDVRVGCHVWIALIRGIVPCFVATTFVGIRIRQRLAEYGRSYEEAYVQSVLIPELSDA
jgi:hypothetical protein